MIDGPKEEPVIEIRTDFDGKDPTAVFGIRPLERDKWRITKVIDRTEGEPIEGIIELARALVAKVSSLGTGGTMEFVEIMSGSAGNNVPGAEPDSIRIRAQWPREEKSEEGGQD